MHQCDLKKMKNHFIILLQLLGVMSAKGARQLFEGDKCEIHTGDVGNCTKSIDCPWLQVNLANKEITHNDIVRCGFQNDKTLIVCCASDHNVLLKDDRGLRSETRPAETACQGYAQYQPLSGADRIIGGIEADEGEFPHMAVVGRFSDEIGTDYEWFCGGSLISERYILTAAHCTTDRTRRPTVVRLRDINLSEVSRDELTVVIETITNHPDYRANRKYDDISLLRLEKNVELDVNLYPICLWQKHGGLARNANVTAIGFGVKDVHRKQVSKVLLKTGLAIHNLQDCNQTYIDMPAMRSLPQYVQEGMICAFDSSRRNDTCEGDSGGALQTVVNSRSYIIGITSFGISCATAIPSVYTRVSHYIDWIEDIVWP